MTYLSKLTIILLEVGPESRVDSEGAGQSVSMMICRGITPIKHFSPHFFNPEIIHPKINHPNFRDD